MSFSPSRNWVISLNKRVVWKNKFLLGVVFSLMCDTVCNSLFSICLVYQLRIFDAWLHSSFRKSDECLPAFTEKWAKLSIHPFFTAIMSPKLIGCPYRSDLSHITSKIEQLESSAIVMYYFWLSGYEFFRTTPTTSTKLPWGNSGSDFIDWKLFEMDWVSQLLA